MKFHFNSLRRRTLLLFFIVALSAAMLPTAAFASGYGHQGRGWDPGPRPERGQHRPAQDDQDNNRKKDDHNNDNKDYNKNHNNQPQRCDVTYRVKRGDTLSGIAKHFGVSVNQLAKANGIRNSNRINAGQVLCIPR